MITGLNQTQRAAGHIASALEHLKEAKHQLLNAKSDQHIHLCMNIGALEEIHGTLMDPECTPEITYDYDPQYDDCIWDGDRIDATKRLLFNEHISKGG